jgi:hypothetical protein
MLAIELWPFDHRTRRALVEWPFLNPTDAVSAVEAISRYLVDDPSSPDAIRLRMIYESRLGWAGAARRDARALQAFERFPEP